METSLDIGELAAALAKAKAEMKPALKTAINPAFARGGNPGSKYATLADCDEAATSALSANGLAMMQGIHGSEFVARLVHSSGQWAQIRVPVPGEMSKLTIQQLGAITTYLRRQTYSLVGLVTDEDDDGNEAARAGGFQHDPRGDLGKSVDTKTVNKWAKAMIDQQDNAHRLVEIWDEIKGDHDLAVAVWASIPKPIKDRVKDAREQA